MHDFLIRILRRLGVPRYQYRRVGGLIECVPGTVYPIMKGGAVEQRSDFGGEFYTTATVDPASIGAVASGDTVVTVAGILSTDKVIAIPPATMLAGLAVQGVHTIIAGGFTLRLTNASAGALDQASATWGFIVFRL